MALTRPENLGERLVSQGLLTEAQLELALKEQKRLGESLGRVLCRLRFTTEDLLAGAIAKVLHLRRVTLRDAQIQMDLLKTIPKDFALKYLFVPLCDNGQILEIAMADPFDVVATDGIEQRTGRILRIHVATESEIREMLSQGNSSKDSINGRIEEAIDRAVGENESQKPGNRLSGEEEIGAAIVQLVDEIIRQGISEGATDIHLEPEENLLRVRYRIDGILQQGCVCPKRLQNPVTSRIKVVANLNISERRIPQDGRFHISFETGAADIRVSMMPTAHGENTVLRILEKNATLLDLSSLGFPDPIRREFTRVLNCPYGIILVTGPTGSGKSTTLYSALSMMNSMEKKVVTVEDPIEYQLPLIRQSQVNPQVGYTFAAGLRSILRQDPDIIMVGEIRDLETAQIAIRAGLTGHLVLSTLHTNNAPSAFTRLADMGVEPFLINSSVLGVLAQRLIRRLCMKCRQEHDLSSQDALFYERHGMTPPEKLYQGRGCISCRQTGYRGRVGIYELFVPDEKARGMLLNSGGEMEIVSHATKSGMEFMIHDGLRKASLGLTTLEELNRVILVDH